MGLNVQATRSMVKGFMKELRQAKKLSKNIDDILPFTNGGFTATRNPASKVIEINYKGAPWGFDKATQTDSFVSSKRYDSGCNAFVLIN